MDKLIKAKNIIEKMIYHKDDMPKILKTIFSTTEYLSYSVACWFIIYGIAISLINIIYFIKLKEEDIFLLYKIRLILGQLLNISLTIILGGLVVRLLHITNLKTILLIVITILLKELIISNIDKESSFIGKKMNILNRI